MMAGKFLTITKYDLTSAQRQCYIDQDLKLRAFPKLRKRIHAHANGKLIQLAGVTMKDVRYGIFVDMISNMYRIPPRMVLTKLIDIYTYYALKKMKQHHVS